MIHFIGSFFVVLMAFFSYLNKMSLSYRHLLICPPGMPCLCYNIQSGIKQNKSPVICRDSYHKNNLYIDRKRCPLSRRKFFILTASIGAGHSQAARAIAESIKAVHPEDSARVLDFLSRDVLSLDHVLKESYFKMINVFPEMYDSLYNNSQNKKLGSTFRSLLSWSFRRRMKRLITVLKPDALIFTHPFPACAANLLKKEGDISTPLLGVITDFDIHQLWVYKHLDAYCVPNDELAHKLAEHNVPESIIHTTGIPVRKSFYEELRHPHPKVPGTILLMGGGLGLGDLTDTLKRLDDLDEVSRFIVATGQNITVYEEVAALKNHLRHPVELHSYTNKIPQMMAESELIVTKPGALTCTEALTMKLPMVLANALPGHERVNAEHLEKNGCAVWAKRKTLAAVVKDLLSHPEKRQKMVEACGTHQQDSSDAIVKVLDNMLKSM
jgi:processive 1,2-diacylglycerol beta-glucosyltransferase